MKFVKKYEVYEAQCCDVIHDIIIECIDLRKTIDDDILLIFNDIYILINEKTSPEEAYQMYREKKYRKE